LNRIALIFVLLALQACSDPAFYFRGYNSDSTCSRIIDTELALGGEFVDAYESRDPEVAGYITELAGEIFEEPVRIDIRCERGNHTAAVHYISTEQEPEATGALYAKFTSELEAQFGISDEELGEINRSRFFLCDDPAPIFLEEWALENDEDEDQEPEETRRHELYLAIVPDAAVCLANRAE